MNGTRSRLIPNLVLKFPRKWPKSMWNSCREGSSQNEGDRTALGPQDPGEGGETGSWEGALLSRKAGGSACAALPAHSPGS